MSLILPKKNLIKPTRREFIKTAGMAMSCAAFPHLAKAIMLSRGGSISPPIATPSQASAAGYNNLVFFSGFDSPGEVDVNNTLNPGYKWYVQTNVNVLSPQNNAAYAIPSNAFSFANSVMTINGPNVSWAPAIGTAAYQGFSTPSQAGSPGTLFAKTAGYWEVKMSSTVNGTGGAPFFFMIDNQVIQATGKNGAGGGNTTFTLPGVCEIDMVEKFGSPYDIDCYNWYNAGSGGQVSNTNKTPNNQPNFSSMQTIGTLVQPANGGTGTVTPYVNGVAQSNVRFTYTASGISSNAGAGAQTGWMSGLDAGSGQGFNLFIGVGANGNLSIDYVAVWQ